MEAALVVPVFLISVFAVVRFFALMDFQNTLQIEIENAARNMYGDYDNIQKVYAGYNIVAGEAGDMAQSAGVTCGRYGLAVKLYNSENSAGSDRISYIQASYIWNGIKFKQKLHYINWNGKSILDSGANAEDDKTVYITPAGAVYHTTSECTYLTRDIKKETASEIANCRNSSGGKYYKCEKCMKDTSNVLYVYYTVYGDRYHSSKECRTLKRYIKAIKLSSAGNRKCCSKCGGNKEE